MMKEICLYEIITPILIPDNDKVVTHLMQSIRKLGQLNPIDVRLHPKGGYTILNGKRRVKVCRSLGGTTIFANVFEMSDEDEIEYMLRASSNFIETYKKDYAITLRHFIDVHPELTLQDIATSIDISLEQLIEKIDDCAK